MGTPRRTPVIVGVGEIKNASKRLEDAADPAELMLRAIRAAIQDSSSGTGAGSKLQSEIDCINVVATWTWSYPDLPGLLAEKLGVQPRHKCLSPHGGNSPAKMLDDAARRVSKGESKVAIVTGGEALASLQAFSRAQKMPNWPEQDPNAPSIVSPRMTRMKESVGSIHSIGLPIHVYPLYENGFRAHRGQSIAENNKESARLYAEFAKVAEKHPAAWNYGKPAETEESIGTVSKSNRMICFPYPLLMNAFNTVNLAVACIVTSAEFARQLDIPEDRWVYPLGGAGTADSEDFWQRPNFFSSPSISQSIDAALQVSGLKKEEIDLYDFYSCFPIVPKLACHHLGLPFSNSPKPITLLGGLTSFGGAGNNYSAHAIVAMVRELRKAVAGSSSGSGSPRHGLILANGGVLSYQHVVCLSNRPRRDGSSYPAQNPLPEHTNVPAPAVDEEPEGEAVIETYTLDYTRDGRPQCGFVIGRLKKNGHRFIANHADENTLRQLASTTEEQIGRTGYVRGDPEQKGRNLFTFEKTGKL
ncbi:hypothetical protein VTO42DRAFT_8251 [Malbranchea cinnamomea]